MSIHAPIAHNTNQMNQMQLVEMDPNGGMYATLPNGAHAPLATASSSVSAPIRITRRLNVRIQGSLSDFAQVNL